MLCLAEPLGPPDLTPGPSSTQERGHCAQGLGRCGQTEPAQPVPQHSQAMTSRTATAAKTTRGREALPKDTWIHRAQVVSLWLYTRIKPVKGDSRQVPGQGHALAPEQNMDPHPARPHTHIFRISLLLSPRIWKSPSKISGR